MTEKEAKDFWENLNLEKKEYIYYDCMPFSYLVLDKAVLWQTSAQFYLMDLTIVELALLGINVKMEFY